MKEVERLDPESKFKLAFEDIFNDPLVPVEWDQEKKDKVAKLTGDARLTNSRVASIPMICRGSSCPISHRCPLYKEDLHPLNMSCPIESKMVAELMIGIMTELDVDPESIIEVGMVRDFVDQEIQQVRKQEMLAKEDIIQETVVGVDDSGDVVTQPMLHLAVSWEDKIHKRKASLLKQLVATREARVNAGARVLDQATNMANIMNNFAKLQKEEARLLDDVGIGSKDDYIESQIALSNGEAEEDEG